MGNHKNGCHGCGGCNKANKPLDCKSDGCGRCCGGSCSSKGTKEDESKFMVTLLERYYLPILITDEKVIYMESKEWNLKDIESYNTIIKKFEAQGYLTIDQEELDEYSYGDYQELIKKYQREGIDVTKGTIAVTKYSLDTFLI